MRSGAVSKGREALHIAIKLRYRNDAERVSDGPYAEIKALRGGLLTLEATDMNHAIQLISNRPGIKMRPWELRPAEDLSAMMAERAAVFKGEL
ncbi:hypothetical protein MKFW12EY_29180 [Methylomonas koyamae]|nr:hypothetical protein MKFW12EY_29180 [Methylomonas koyamae]